MLRDKTKPVLCLFNVDDRTIVFAQDLGHRQVGARRRAAELLAVGFFQILVFEKAMQK